MNERRIHYALIGHTRTLCGRLIGMVRVTAYPDAVTCEKCYSSHELDGMLNGE